MGKKINPNLVIVAGLAAGGAFVIWKGKRVVTDAAQAINPVNNDNIFSRGANAIVQTLTGDPHQTLGGQVYDWVHGTRSTTQDELRKPGASGQ